MKEQVYRCWFLAVLLMVCAATGARAAGEVGADFLLIAPAARAAALGEAQTALADEGYGFHYNPAGIVHNRVTRLTTSYAFYIEHGAYEYISLVYPLDAVSVAGISVTGLQVKDTRRDLNGREGGEFTNSDFAMGLTYGRKISFLRVGGTIKYIHRSLDVYSADAYAADFGVQGDITEDWFWGASVANAGGDLKFISEGDPLPRILRAGIGTYALERKLLLLADVQQLRGQGAGMHVGLEWMPLENIFIRLGYVKFGEQSIESSFRAGAGLKHSMGDFDYAFGDFDNLGYVHRLTFSMPFGTEDEPSGSAAPAPAPEDDYDRLYQEYLEQYYRETR